MKKKKIIYFLIIVIFCFILLRIIGGPVYRYYNPNKYNISEFKTEDGRFAYSIDGVNYIQSDKYVTHNYDYAYGDDFEKIYRKAIFFNYDITLYKLNNSDDFLLMKARHFGNDYYLKEGVSFETMDISYYQFDLDNNKGRYYIEDGVRHDYNDGIKEKNFKLRDLHDVEYQNNIYDMIIVGKINIYFENGLMIIINVGKANGEYYLRVRDESIFRQEGFYRIPKEYLE